MIMMTYAHLHSLHECSLAIFVLYVHLCPGDRQDQFGHDGGIVCGLAKVQRCVVTLVQGVQQETRPVDEEQVFWWEEH